MLNTSTLIVFTPNSKSKISFVELYSWSLIEIIKFCHPCHPERSEDLLSSWTKWRTSCHPERREGPQNNSLCTVSTAIFSKLKLSIVLYLNSPSLRLSNNIWSSNEPTSKMPVTKFLPASFVLPRFQLAGYCNIRVLHKMRFIICVQFHQSLGIRSYFSYKFPIGSLLVTLIKMVWEGKLHNLW